MPPQTHPRALRAACMLASASARCVHANQRVRANVAPDVRRDAARTFSALCAVLHKLLAVLLWACGQHYRAALPAVSMWPAFSRAALPGASACTPCLSRARRRRQRRWDGVRSWRTGALVVRRPVIKKRLHPAPKGAPGCAPMRGPPDALRTPRDLCLTPRKNSGTSGGPTTARDPPLTFQPPGIHR